MAKSSERRIIGQDEGGEDFGQGNETAPLVARE